MSFWSVYNNFTFQKVILMDEFYVTLLSNSNSIYFENTSANFKIKLPKPLLITDKWVMGLADISYTYRWYNIRKDESIRIKYFDKGIIKNINGIIPSGYYSIHQLVDTINRVM